MANKILRYFQSPPELIDDLHMAIRACPVSGVVTRPFMMRPDILAEKFASETKYMTVEEIVAEEETLP
jgi:hypothetical protein